MAMNMITNIHMMMTKNIIIPTMTMDTTTITISDLPTFTYSLMH